MCVSDITGGLTLPPYALTLLTLGPLPRRNLCLVADVPLTLLLTWIDLVFLRGTVASLVRSRVRCTFLGISVTLRSTG